MKHYLEIANRYFQQLEGLQLYPSVRNIWFWAWLVSTGVWLIALVHFAGIGHPFQGPQPIGSILVPELVWLLVTFRVNAWKEKQLVDTTNRIHGTSFKSAAQCRSHVLTSVMAVPPADFLRVAKEIDDLRALHRKFRRKSDITLAEFGRMIYDKDSKPRLLALIIALVSMTVALAVKRDATLESLFEVYSDPGSRQFLFLLAFLAAIAFLAYVGLRILVLTIIDALARWAIKLSRGSAFSDWLLAYLVRDLVTFHAETANTPRQLHKL